MSIDPVDLHNSALKVIGNLNSLLTDKNGQFTLTTLAESHPDVLIDGPIPVGAKIADFLGAELLKFTAYHPEPIGSVLINNPSQYTYATPFLVPKKFMIDNLSSNSLVYR